MEESAAALGSIGIPQLETHRLQKHSDRHGWLLNNMFGGIALQTAMLAIADLVAVNVAITRFLSKPTPILEGVLLILTLALLQGKFCSVTPPC